MTSSRLSRLLAPTLLALSLCTAPLLAQAGDVEFGQVASHTNPTSATLGKGMTVGIQVYFDKVNANGGILGSKLTLVRLDDDLQGEKNIVGPANVFPLRSSYTDEVAALLKEAKKWDKDTLAVVSMNTAFGPPMAQVANQLSGPQGVRIVMQNVLDVAPERLDASIRNALAAIKQTNPKAILLLASGKPAAEFIKAVRDVQTGSLQIYGLSVLSNDVLVNAIGKEKARGIVISQALPFPFVPSISVITEYQNDMKKYAPGEPLSFPSLEGYLGAKIAAEGVRRAGKNPTRAALVKALSSLGEYNLGGMFVNYSATKRTGWGGVELSIINASGNLQK